MNIEYNNGLEDYVNFNLLHARHSPTIRRQQMLLRLIVSVAVTTVLIIIALSSSGGASLYEIVMALVFGVTFFLILPLFNRSGMRRQIEKMIKESKNEGGFGKQKMVIASEAITEENDAGESKYFWSSLDKLVGSPNYIFLYVGALKALIIPRNSFADEAQCTKFVELVEQYYSKATGKSLPRFEWK